MMRLLLYLVAGMLLSCSASKKTLRPDPDVHPENAAVHRSESALGAPIDSIAPKKCSIAPDFPAPARRLFGLLPPAKPKNSAGKIKNSTIIYQVGQGNTAGAATKPGNMATGTNSAATDAKKAAGPVITGDGNQGSSSRKGAAVAGDGNSVTQPEAGWPWWKWLGIGLVVGFALRQFGPRVWRLARPG
ncbi:hypothetical protein [Hymenobacter sp. B81]|uniref:hypothetical protein n=1 Tax=Hymenobacter sp. B81 TaxID=3344878 RepID=UPI0037DCC7B2